ncbi:MAG TPA: hypothetical protein VND70_11140 [Acidimicrobiales bacterium]|nr:hypothetical protein [Acidimicrobiales bacterium]
MDEVERKRFLDTLRQDDGFRSEVRRALLTEELLGLPQTVAVLAASISGLVEHQAEMQRALSQLSGDVATLVTTTRQLFEIVQSGFAEVRRGFISVDSRLDQVDAEVREIRDQPGS